MSKTSIEYLPVAYNFGACSDLREFVRQAQADFLCKDPPLPSPEPPPTELVKPNSADTPVDGDDVGA